MTSRPTVILLHCRYRERGGEDEVFAAELDLLRSHGWAPLPVVLEPADVATLRGRLRTGLQAVWSREWAARIGRLCRQTRAKIVHVHNYFPTLSPAVFRACAEAGVPVVHTLHNYRICCPNALLLREGRPCHACVGKRFAWPGVVHGCYHGSRAETAAVAAISGVHRAMGTWTGKVDGYIALSEFSRRTFIEAGLPEEKIFVKPNFHAPDLGPGDENGGFVLFAGRLADYKGVMTMLEAWEGVDRRIRLLVAGDGPLAGAVGKAVRDRPNIEWLGRRSKGEVLTLMKRATALIHPSLSYENFPLAIVEAFATGLPVIASRRGAAAELVEHGRTGRLCAAGQSESLAAEVNWIHSHPRARAAMRSAARAEYLEKYTAEKNYQRLMEIYGRVMENGGS